jgi:hypothetical protein
MENIEQQWIVTWKIPKEYTPVTFYESLPDDTRNFKYGATIQQLRPGIEVLDNGSSLYASIFATGTQSIPNTTNTTVTGLSTKVWDTTMTATSDQITITKSWNYLLNAYSFCGWSSNIYFAILKNWTAITPHFRSGTSSYGSITASINSLQSLVVWDILTLRIYQDSGGAQTLQNMYLAVSKL